MFLRIIFLVLIVCQDLVLKWSLCQLLFSVVRERVDHAFSRSTTVIGQNLKGGSCRKFIQHLETCLLWQLKLTEFLVNLWCLLLSFSTRCIKWNTAARFQTDLGRENSASHFKIQAGKTEAFRFSYHSHALITLFHALRPSLVKI